MTVGELIEKLNNVENKDAVVVIDMIDRLYSCFDFYVDSSNVYAYLVNDHYLE